MPLVAADTRQVAGQLQTLLLYKLRVSCIPILFIASMGLLAQASNDCNDLVKAMGHCRDSNVAYAVAVGTISVAVSITYLAVEKRRPAYLVQNALIPKITSAFLLIWWSAAVATLTGDSPYPSTAAANGYFTSWVGFFASGMFFYVVVGAELLPDASAAIDNVPLFGTLVASGVEAISAVIVCGRADQCSGFEAYAVAVGVVSFFVCCVILVTKIEQLQQSGAVFLLCWWIPGVYFCTFNAPFTAAGNGYFSSWASLFFAASFAFEARTSEQVHHSMGTTPAPDASFSTGGDPNDTPYVHSGTLDSPDRGQHTGPYVASATHDKLNASLVDSEVGTPSEHIPTAAPATNSI